MRFGTTILIMVLLANSGLSQAEIDAYEVFWFLASMLSFFWVSASINAALSQFPQFQLSDQKKAFFNLFLFFTGVSVLISGVLYWSANWFAETFSFQDELPYIPLLALFLVFQTPSWLVQIYYLLLKKYEKIFLYGTIIFAVQILAVVVPLLFGGGLSAIFQLLIALAAFKFLWLILILIKYATFQLDTRILYPFLLLAFPLVLKAFLNHGYEYIDGFIVNTYFQEENLFAVFRYGAREMPYVTLFIGAIVTAILPEVALNLNKGMADLKEKTLRLARWMFPLSALFMLISPLVFERVFNPEFRASAFVFNVYLLMLSSRILLPQVIVMAKKANYFLVLSAFIEIIVNVALSLILVRIVGLTGIAFASVIAFYVNKINQIVFLKIKYGISPHSYIPLRLHFVLSLLLYGSFLASLFLYEQI